MGLLYFLISLFLMFLGGNSAANLLLFAPQSKQSGVAHRLCRRHPPCLVVHHELRLQAT